MTDLLAPLWSLLIRLGFLFLPIVFLESAALLFRFAVSRKSMDLRRVGALSDAGVHAACHHVEAINDARAAGIQKKLLPLTIDKLPDLYANVVHQCTTELDCGRAKLINDYHDTATRAASNQAAIQE